jgi:hypothetical protein
MELFNGKPLYAVSVDPEETGMFCISLVDDPATEVDFLAFNKDEKPMEFAVQDEEKRMVRGVVMTCDSPIYRRDKNGYEYYVTYSKDTIRTMAEKYLAMGFQNNVDEMHSWELEEGIHMQEFFIKDTENGINPKGFESVKDGSLFAQFHVLNDDVWNAIKDGTYKGFSLAGQFAVEPVEDDEEFSSIMEIIDKINNRIKRK